VPAPLAWVKFPSGTLITPACIAAGSIVITEASPVRSTKDATHPLFWMFIF
jgi:hypothetical protein